MSGATGPAAVTPRAPGRFRGNARQAYDLALAGAAGALFGLYLYVELVHARYGEAVYALPVYLRDALAGVAIGGAVGFFLNASGPFRDGAWLKLARAAAWGAGAGAIGGCCSPGACRTSLLTSSATSPSPSPTIRSPGCTTTSPRRIG